MVFPKRPVPYRFIAGLDQGAQREIERNFAWITDSLIPQLYGLSIMIAASDASAAEKLRADYQCSGVADQTIFIAALTAHPDAMVLLSSGTFNFTATLTGMARALIGLSRDSTVLNFAAGTYSNNKLGGKALTTLAIPYVSDLSVVATGLTLPSFITRADLGTHITVERVQTSGVAYFVSPPTLSILKSIRGFYRDIEMTATAPLTEAGFAVNSMRESWVENVRLVNSTGADLTTAFIEHTIVIEPRGWLYTLDGTSFDLVLPVTDADAIHIGDAAGGDLAGTYPDPTVPGLATVSPPGGIMLYAGVAAPTDWLLCDGSAVSRTTYADLFAVIGTTFGVGNGSTTFNLPDLRDRLPMGASGTKALGSTLAAATHTHGVASLTLSNHTHTGAAHTHGLTGASVGSHTHTMANHTHTGANHTHTMGNHTHTGAAHTHGLTGASVGTHTHALTGAAAEITIGGAGAPVMSINRVTVSSWTDNVEANFASAGTGGNAKTAGAQLIGSTDTTAPSLTGPTDSTTPGAGSTPSSNAVGGTLDAAQAPLPPYQALNYIIKT